MNRITHPHHSTKPAQSYIIKRELSWMLGIVIYTVNPSDRKIDASPWSRHRYKTVLQGYIALGDAYTRRHDELFSGIPNKTNTIHRRRYFRAVQWLDLSGRNDITLHIEVLICTVTPFQLGGGVVVRRNRFF